jgi:polysaccharide biosynthesis transport protein
VLKSLTTKRKNSPRKTQEIRGLTESPIVVRSAGSSSGERPSEILDPTPTNGQISYSFTASGAPEHTASLVHYWRILRKRKWTVLATLVVIWALSAIATLRETRLYEAVSELAVFPENTNVLGLKDGQGPSAEDWDYSVALETQTAILRSDSLALKVIQSMHLSQDPRFAGEQASHPDPSRDLSALQPSDGETTNLLAEFHAGLGVRAIPRTRLIEIRYLHHDPNLAKEIVNALSKTYIEENFKKKYESLTQTSEWLSKELTDLQLTVETSEEKVVRYQKAHSILGIDEKQNIVTAKLDELNKELTEAQTDRIQKEANHKLAQTTDPIVFAKASPTGASSLLDKLLEKEADLNTTYAQATTQFGTGYPKVVELGNQLKQVRIEIQSEQARMQNRIRDEYLGALQREALLTSAFEDQKQQANQLNESAIEYSSLKRDAESNRQLYQALLQRMKEAGVTAGLQSSNIRVVDAARTPTYPVKPNIPRNLKLGFLLGLCSGVGLAFLLESLDTTVGNIEQVSAISTLPVLGIIPLQLANNGNLQKRLKAVQATEAQVESPMLMTHMRPKSQAAESYRALRTSILLSSFGAPPKVILVTSALPQEGKTTISANSAVVLAQRGSRVLLIDADLRRPGIGKMMGIKSYGGLSTLISGSHKVEDVMVPSTEVPNLWILPAGPIPPQPAELLSSDVMRSYIARWRGEFDHIIIDTPPCLSVTDAVVLSAGADRVILVARSGQTTKIALRRACDLLLQVNAKVMGIVLNALNLRSGDGYYYSYGGTYDQRYYDDETSENGAAAASKVS